MTLESISIMPNSDRLFPTRQGAEIADPPPDALELSCHGATDAMVPRV